MAGAAASVQCRQLPRRTSASRGGQSFSQIPRCYETTSVPRVARGQPCSVAVGAAAAAAVGGLSQPFPQERCADTLWRKRDLTKGCTVSLTPDEVLDCAGAVWPLTGARGRGRLAAGRHSAQCHVRHGSRPPSVSLPKPPPPRILPRCTAVLASPQPDRTSHAHTAWQRRVVSQQCAWPL